MEHFSMAIRDAEVRTYIHIKNLATLKDPIYDACECASVRREEEKTAPSMLWSGIYLF